MAFFLILVAASCWAETRAIVATEYYHTFSAAHPVLLRIQPGDTVRTKTVDSAGFDFQGIRRTKTHGNPLTGPFFVAGAEPGDALAVTIRKLSLNRASGYTGYQVGLKNLPSELAGSKPAADSAIRGYDYLVPWEIDLTRGMVRPAGARRGFEFSAAPMLGCIGVAPEGNYSPRSGPAGYWGGNLDYNMVREGTTVYLPVFHPGALLFFGDGHALQGDGEAVGSGVETSLDVEVTVELRKKWTLSGPRAETADQIISIGAKPDATLNESLLIATVDMLRWLTADYKFTASEANLLLGVRARYDVVTLGGSVALRISKTALRR